MIEPIKIIKGTGLPLSGDDIDTDRIIPARFLRCVTFDGLGENAFYDERYSNGSPTAHPMNDAVYKGATVMISGFNFGCGSSREHAPQAIKRAGYKAVIAGSFAEIFYGNSSILGLVCVNLDKSELTELTDMVKKEPKTIIELDMVNKIVKAGGKTFKMIIKDTLRSSLLEGTYDILPELLKNKSKISEYDAGMPPRF